MHALKTSLWCQLIHVIMVLLTDLKYMHLKKKKIFLERIASIALIYLILNPGTPQIYI